MTLYIDIHTHSAAPSSGILKIVNDGPESGFFSAGLHPWHLISESLGDSLKTLEKKLSLPFCAALGEAGLDKICKTPPELQHEAFVRQIELAENYSKPLIIHCVKAVQEVMALKKSSNVPWIFHGFNSSPETAKSLVAKGFYLSFGAVLLDSEKTKNAFATVPSEKIFFETDESSVPVKDIYSEAARLRNISVKELCNLVKNNFTTVFGDIIG